MPFFSVPNPLFGTKRRRTGIWVTRTQRTKTFVTRKKEKTDWGDEEAETMLWVTRDIKVQ